MSEILNAEQYAGLQVILRAVEQLFTTLDAAPAARLTVPLVENLVQSALIRAKPNRRMAYLDQWRQFLCWLPDALATTPAEQRQLVAAKALHEFQLQDRRGKTKPGLPFPQGANCLVLRDGEFWYAKAPKEGLIPRALDWDPPPKALEQRFQAGQRVYEEEELKSSIDVSKVQYLRPLNPPRVLKLEHKRILRLLPGNDPPDEDSVVPLVTDVPEDLLRKWAQDGVTRSDLALLIAARRACMTAKETNLSHLHEALKWAR